MVANKFGRNIKVLRADNGREYSNSAMNSYLNSRSIVLENIAPYIPEQNGKAECENRTIVESTRIIIHVKGLPKNCEPKLLIRRSIYWIEFWSRKKKKSKKKIVIPYELWYGRKPNLSHIKTFGIDVYAHIDKQFRKKMDRKAEKYILVAYQGESTNYRLYDPEVEKVIISRNVIFNEIPTTKSLSSTSPGIRLPAEKSKAPDNGEVSAETMKARPQID